MPITPLLLSEYSVTSLDVIHHADALAFLRGAPSNWLNCVVTSPPYYGLRDYSAPGQIGLEDTPEQYVARLVVLFREVRRVLRDDGVLWLNLGDSYYNHSPTRRSSSEAFEDVYTGGKISEGTRRGLTSELPLKMKDLIGIPWRVAFALQADGWYLRSDIIWHKPNPMPESVTDRPTKAHEYVFLLTKSERYWYDADAIRVKATSTQNYREPTRGMGYGIAKGANGRSPDRDGGFNAAGGLRNRRSVWTVPTEPKPFAHFAMFPQALIEPMILAGCPVGGVVYDPFMGSGTTALVAQRLGRHYVGTDLNREYVELARDRLRYRGDDRRMMREKAAGVEQIALFSEDAA